MGFIASLMATVGVNTDPLNKGLGGAKQSLQGFGKEMAKQVIGTVSLATAVYKAGQTVVESIVNWADYADTMRLSAQMAGVTTEEMSRLSQAADDFRVPIETMQRSMEMALKNGFTPTIENIAALSDELLGITDPAARAAAASKIFGKSYADMMPFLLAGGDAIRSATSAIDGSLVVTAEAAAEAKAYKDQLDALGDAWTGLKNILGQSLVPVITNVFSGLTEELTKFTLQTLLAKAAMEEFNATGGADLGALMSNLWTAFGKGSTTEELQGALSKLGYNFDFVGASASAAVPGVAALTEEEQASIASALAAAEAQAKLNDELINITTVGGNYQGIIDLAYEFTDMLEQKETLQIERQKLLNQGWSEQSTKVKELTDNISKLDADMKKMADQVTLDMFKATIAVGGVTQAELAAYTQMAIDMGYMSEEGAKMAIEAYGNAIDTINGLDIDEKTGNVNIDAAAAFFTLDLLQQYAILDKEARVFVKTYYGTYSEGNYDREPGEQGLRASGGLSFADTPYIVGERGPELFVPDTTGQVIPNNALDGGNSDMLGDILLELQSQPARIKVAIKEAMALVGG